MTPIFDETVWKRKIKSPNWFLDVPRLIVELGVLHDSNWSAYSKVRDQIYTFFEDELKAGNVALGTTGRNLDLKRKTLDTVVIHHTSNLPGLTKSRLSAMELLRLYAPQFAGKGPTYDANREIRNQPIYSGHFRDGKQVFWPYHWIVRADGTPERLLYDSEIGWQSGNWEMNCRSIAIAFDNDYENGSPSDIELIAVANLITKEYPHVPSDRILGHCEVNMSTSCPSTCFLSVGSETGWKERLLSFISNKNISH